VEVTECSNVVVFIRQVISNIRFFTILTICFNRYLIWKTGILSLCVYAPSLGYHISRYLGGLFDAEYFRYQCDPSLNSLNTTTRNLPTAFQSTQAPPLDRTPSGAESRPIPSTGTAYHPPIAAFIRPQLQPVGSTNERRLAAAQRTLPHHRRGGLSGRRATHRGGRNTFQVADSSRGCRRLPDEFSHLPNTEFLAICLPFTVGV
jgi:hypothetical protein